MSHFLLPCLLFDLLHFTWIRLSSANACRRVAEAYATPANNKKYFCVSILALLLLATGTFDGGDTKKKTNNKRKRAQKLRNRAENAPEQIVQKQAELNQKADAEEVYELLNDTFDAEDSFVIDEMVAEDELEGECALCAYFLHTALTPSC